MELKFERVRGFGSYKGAYRGVDGQHVRCFLASDRSVIECDENVIPDIMLYDSECSIVTDWHEESKLCHTRLDGHLRRRANTLSKLPFVDTVVAVMYNTVVIHQGDRMKCSCMYSVVGYGKNPQVRRLSDIYAENVGQYVYCNACLEIFEDDTLRGGNSLCPSCVDNGVEACLCRTAKGTYECAVSTVEELKKSKESDK